MDKFFRGRIYFLLKSSSLLPAVIISSVFVLLLCVLIAPTWETNDDVAMSMVAHGYGIAATGSPNIIFSNIIWGYIVRSLPTFNGVLGYSIGTFGVLIIAGAAIIYGLIKSGVSYIASILVFILIMARPILFPQFTINSGLLMVSSVIFFNLYEKTENNISIIFACAVAFLSYLVRSQEFLLITLIALPLLPWRAIKRNRCPKLVIAVLLTAVSLSAVLDHMAYQGADWKEFNDLNPARAPFTDFGAGTALQQRPDLLREYSYSPNDIYLITNWFFVDSNIAAPDKLNAIIKKLGPLPSQGNPLSNAWLGVKTLSHPTLLPMVLIALLISIMYPNRKVIIAGGLCITAVFMLGLVGRPGVLRVYVPMVALIMLSPLLCRTAGHRWRERVAIFILLLAVLFNTSTVYSEAKSSETASREIYGGLKDFPSDSIVSWGAGFPYEAAYPPLSPMISSLRIYGLGVFTLAPFSIASQDQKNGNGMLEMLKREEGVPIIGTRPNFSSLDIYCKERLQGNLSELYARTIDQISVSWRRCETGLQSESKDDQEK